MVLFFAGWVMVGIMATSWRSRSGSTAFSVAVGLLALALMLVASSPAWYGDDQTRLQTGAAQVWAPGGWMAQPSTTPATAFASEHPPAFWRLRNPATWGAADSLASLRVPTWPDPGAIRSPQQTAHRTAGSRSPPAI